MKPDTYKAWLRNMGNLTNPPANILELPMGERAEMALKAAVEKVVESHIQDGRPISIWRDGKVVGTHPGVARHACQAAVISCSMQVTSCWVAQAF
jgi:hypothetical protein